ncbi:hypothetical protein TNCT_678941 [Trichonephila clavata]|uniref:Uncharacterized protein n=1 Tax=Trichonephila clavata TaxID=2740835 RepID=A0A8X6HSE2_TRICU|nr:hypothetical protein TNCT_678941 [Trichonephila clavata]
MTNHMDSNEGPSTKDTRPMDPCKEHTDMATSLLQASAHRQYAEDILNCEMTRRADKKLIQKYQMDVTDLNGLMEQLKGELASFYLCPNPDCYGYNNIPDFNTLVDGVIP